ncbi:MAG: hypothetical protein BWY95_01960 [Bacteroidetes bacterium ADurb.BinA104]|nr:MAG: hypothetical protein BWY95_01960 [Bacteroidetes bacterium ADurb.BinA104]
MRKIATFYWMLLSNGESRSVPEWSHSNLKDALITGYYGNNGYVGVETVENNRGSYADYRVSERIFIRNGRKYLVR